MILLTPNVDSDILPTCTQVPPGPDWRRFFFPALVVIYIVTLIVLIN